MILALLGVKVASKFIGVWPSARAFKLNARAGNYMTLLMSTRLTFGTISALSGLTNHIIDKAQYTILVTVVLASAVVPTLIAQTWFLPKAEVDRDEVTAYENPAAEEQPMSPENGQLGGADVSGSAQNPTH